MNLHEYTTNDGMTTHKVGSVRLFGASITWRETRGEDSWRCVAVLSGSLPKKPKGGCEGNSCWRRQPCDFCCQYEIWAQKITSVVHQVTDWSLYSWYSGPGRGFADEPFVFKKGSRVKVCWSGGLDV